MDRGIKIGIIGSGIAGLSVALALHNAGFSQVTIYERDDCFDRRRQGYGLTMLQGLSALKRLGLFEKIRQIDTPSRSHYIFDCEGNIISFFGTKFWPTPPNISGRKSKHNLHISRQNLRKILHDELCRIRPGTVHWDKKLISMNNGRLTNGGHLWELEFANGDLAEMDLVIGCDGINSFVRRHKYGGKDYPLKYLGIILVLGITRTDHYLSQERVFQTVDGNTRLFAMPFYGDEKSPHENIMWQLSFPVDEAEARELAGDLDLLKATILEKCGNWHDPIPSLIESTDSSLFTGYPAYDRDPVVLPVDNFQLEAEGLVLLGDAAHPMSPFKGQGANQALLDGVNFVDHLIRKECVQDAITSFESEMWTRVRKKVLDSRERATTFHHPDILDGEFFFYRGVGTELLQRLRNKGINVRSGDEIDKLIMSELSSSDVTENNNICSKT